MSVVTLLYYYRSDVTVACASGKVYTKTNKTRTPNASFHLLQYSSKVCIGRSGSVSPFLRHCDVFLNNFSLDGRRNEKFPRLNVENKRINVKNLTNFSNRFFLLIHKNQLHAWPIIT